MTGPLLPIAAPTQLAPDMYAWAFVVPTLRAVLVVEPSYRLDGPPSLHLAVPLPTGAAGADRALTANGWRARAWLPRSWGALARVDIAEPERHDEP